MSVSADDGCGQITALLRRQRAGDREAFDELVSMAYDHLRRVARGQLARGWPSETLSATALVHEAYLRLVRYPDVAWQGRAHFFGAAARTMRRVIVDHARRKTADKRHGEHVRLTDAAGLGDRDTVPLDEVLAVDDALGRLAAERPRWVRVVECRYFAGLTLEETAEALGISAGTVRSNAMRALTKLRSHPDLMSTTLAEESR